MPGMPTVFSMIIAGELPGRFVWQDEHSVAFLSIAPIASGHTLVVPRQEIDQWTDAEPGLLAHCTDVAQRIGQAVKRAWDAPRAGLLIAGFEVAHLHLHVFPVWGLDGFDLASADTTASATDLDENAQRIRDGLRSLGYGAGVPGA
jgi:diadenosine tetraphosphate (Ap4A) HIT family hydrolase